MVRLPRVGTPSALLAGLTIVMVVATWAAAWGATTYTWNGGAAASWADAASWTPAHDTPAGDDVLVFDGGGAVTAYGVPTDTIGQLLISGSTHVCLQAAATGTTLWIDGGNGTDFDVAAGATLELNTENTLRIALGVAATGTVGGAIRVREGAHRLTPTAAGALVFLSGSRIDLLAGFSGRVFGVVTDGTATENSVLFQAGSLFAQKTGEAPFGMVSPASVVTFQPGSLFRVDSTGVAMSSHFSGRTYGDFEYDAPGTRTVIGSLPVSLDDLTVSRGTLNFNLTSMSSAVRGDVLVKSGATLMFAPGSAAAVHFSGAGPQVVTSDGTLEVRSHQQVAIDNASGVTLRSAITSFGTTTVAAGGRLALAALLTHSFGSVTVDGTLQIEAGGALTGGDVAYGSNSALLYATSAAVGNEWRNDWESVGQPVNVTIQAGAGGAVALAGNRDLSGTLTFMSGTIVTGTDTLMVGPNGGISGAGSGTGWVNGNLRRDASTIGPLAFPVGDAAGYAPVELSFGTLTTPGTLTVGTTPAAHGQLDQSAISTSRYVKRIWSFARDAVAGVYDATFHYLPGDVQGGADWSTFVVGRYDGTWSYCTVGAKTSTSTAVAGMSSFSDFAIGEPVQPGLHILTASLLPAGTAGVPYAVPLVAGGGTPPYGDWQVVSGSLPTGLALDPATGAIGGTPTAADTVPFTARVTDAAAATVSKEFSLAVRCPTITIFPRDGIGELPAGTVGVPYSQTITASGGTPPYTFETYNDPLPAGLTLSAGGVLSGTPTVPGDYSVAVRATDAHSCRGYWMYGLMICSTITLSPESLPDGEVGAAYTQVISASGGTAPYVYSVTVGTLPDGLVLVSNGTLSGTPTAAGSYSFTIRARDALFWCVGTREYTILVPSDVNVACPGGTPAPNGALVNVDPSCPADVTVTNTYPALLEIAETAWMWCGVSNLHTWSFSTDGGYSPAVFENCSDYAFGADFTLNGDWDGEGGLRLSPWWAWEGAGWFLANSATGEVACWGGRLPSYSFTTSHGLTYALGTTIRLDIRYEPHALTSADPATVTYSVTYGGHVYSSGPLAFTEGDPAQAVQHGVWGELTPAYVGGYVQAAPGMDMPSTLSATWSDITFTVPVTEREEPAAPARTHLAPAVPNPFRRSTAVAFSLAQGGPVELAVYSVDGRRVRSLVREVREPGEYRQVWDGRDDRGNPVPAGVYYAHLRAPQHRSTRTLTYLK